MVHFLRKNEIGLKHLLIHCKEQKNLLLISQKGAEFTVHPYKYSRTVYHTLIVGIVVLKENLCKQSLKSYAVSVL